MKNKVRFTFGKLLFAVALIGTGVSAVPLNNGPYAPAEQPPLVSLNPLTLVTTSDSEVRFSDRDGIQINISMTESDIFTEIVNEAGETVFSKALTGEPSMGRFADAWSADLNQDGTRDFLMAYPSGGNGLNAGLSHIVILLSNGSGYNLTMTATWFDPEDLIVAGGKPRLIHSTLFGQIDGCVDGKMHSFWVYNLLGFSNGEVRIDNSGAEIFPKVVWYSEAPNFRETDLLTPKQKAELIKRAQSGWRE